MAILHFIACRDCKEKLWIGQGGVIYSGDPQVMVHLADFITERHRDHNTFTATDQMVELFGMQTYRPYWDKEPDRHEPFRMC